MTGTPDDRVAFSAFKSSPSPESLIRLLRAHQERVHRLCFQVLRRAQDAEDAAQEVLIRIVDGVRKINDPDAFRRWVYRVSLNSALEAARKASRRRTHESRAAMKDPPREPLDEDSRRALFEAISRLDDGPRSLLLEHYFEGETLGSLASREGVSAQAVSKRLDRAREEVRRALPASLGAALDLGRLFERGISAPVVPDLVSGAVLAKVHSIAALAAAGGGVMAAKSSIAGITFVVALACFVAGAGTGAALKGRSSRGQVADLERRLAAAERPGVSGSKENRPPAPPKVAREAPGPAAPETSAAGSDKETVSSKLKEKLARYRKWIEAYRLEYDEICRRNPEGAAAYRAHKMADLGELLVGLRGLVCAAPEDFLEFLRDSRNEAYLSSLIIRGLGFYETEDRRHPQEFSSFPRELHDGMMDLLKSGSPAQKRAMLDYFERIFSQPVEFKAVYPQFLDDPDPSFQLKVVHTIAHTGSWTDEAFAAVTRVGQSTTNSDLRMGIANGMTWVTRPEALGYLIERLETTADYMEVISVAQTLDLKIRNRQSLRQGLSTAEQEDRIARAVTAAMGRGFDGATFLVVIRAGISLPSEKLKPILQQAAALAPTEHSRKTVAELIQLVNAGQSTADELRTASWGQQK